MANLGEASGGQTCGTPPEDSPRRLGSDASKNRATRMHRNVTGTWHLDDTY